MLFFTKQQYRTSPKGIIIYGDLNAKTQLIGSGECNQRGELFGEWLCSNNLIVVNRGTSPTFIKGNRSSLIDFTCASPTIFNRVTNWNVITNEDIFSDHQTIAFNILYNNTDLRNTAALKRKRFVYSPTDKNSKKFLESIKNMYAECQDDLDPEKLITRLSEKCNTFLGQPPHPKRPVYWWNRAIAEKRKKCMKIRRILTRLCRTSRSEEIDDIEKQYRTAKNDLNCVMTSIMTYGERHTK